MSRNISVKRSYVKYKSNETSNKNLRFVMQGMTNRDREVTDDGVFVPNISLPLPNEIDVFKKLPDYVYENHQAKEFLT